MITPDPVDMLNQMSEMFDMFLPVLACLGVLGVVSIVLSPVADILELLLGNPMRGPLQEQPKPKRADPTDDLPDSSKIWAGVMGASIPIAFMINPIWGVLNLLNAVSWVDREEQRINRSRRK